MKRLSLAVLGLSALVGCGSDEPAEAIKHTQHDAGDLAPASFTEQVELGGMLYGEHCANCHGDAGQGSGDAPTLVGLDAGALPLEPRAGSVRTTQFETVADVASFAVTNMPPDAPGSLVDEEYWAILAFALSANGIELEEKLTPELAAALTIPR